VVDLILNIKCNCSYDLNPNLTSLLKSEKWNDKRKIICMQKQGYGTFESIKTKTKEF